MITRSKGQVKNYIEEAKRIMKEMQEDSFNFFYETFITISGMKEEEAREVLDSYLFEKFEKSTISDFDVFLESFLKEEEGIQVKSDLNIVPERPVDENEEEDYIESYSLRNSLYEEEKNGEDNSNDTNEFPEEDGEEGSDSRERVSDDSDDSNSGTNDNDFEEFSDEEYQEFFQSFLEKIGLKGLDGEQAELFLYRFKLVVSDIVEDEDFADLITLLIFKVYNNEELTQGEKQELGMFIQVLELGGEGLNIDDEEITNDAIEESFRRKGKSSFWDFDDDDDDDKKDKNSKTQAIDRLLNTTSIPLAASLIFGGPLLAVGALVVLAAFTGFVLMPEEEFEKQRKKIVENKDKLLEKTFLKKTKKEIEEAPKSDKKQKAPEGFIDKIKKKTKKLKKNISKKAKEKYKQFKSKTKEIIKKGKEKISKKEDEKEQQEKDEKELSPDEYKKKYGKCPKGYNWDSEKETCVKIEEQKESYSNTELSYEDLIT